MNVKRFFLLTLLVSLLLPFSGLDAEAKRKGFVVIKAAFKAKQPVPTAVYSEDEPNNTSSVTLGGRRRFTLASILITFNDLLDQVRKGAVFTSTTTGTTDTAGSVKLNILASKFKEDGGFEFTTFNDDESTIREAKVKVVKVSKKGVITLKIKAIFDNVRVATLDENGEEVSIERLDNVKAIGRIKYNPADTL